MPVAFTLVCLVATVVAVTWAARRVDVPGPLLLIAVGIGASFVPFVPQIRLQPEVVLVGILPPLLYAAAIQTSLVDFNANRRPILLLSIGLVAFTTVGVGAVVHWLLPDLGWSAALALGAVVAPPDAVAATAIGKRIGLPRRIVTVLEGESLLNDATALVALRTALAATVTWQQLTVDFLVAAGGGVLVGVLVFLLIGFVRKHLTDTLLDNTISFITPFLAYVSAEAIHASGVLAVVVAGLLLGHRSPVLQTARSRIAARTNWRAIAFVLENSVFLLIGLQARTILTGLTSGSIRPLYVVVVCAATLATVVLLRLVWMFLARYLLVRPGTGTRHQIPDWRYSLLLGWAGMRGVVTLAAAFVIPVTVPHQEVLLLAAFAVTAGTLFLQGLTLPMVARRLRVPSPDPSADALARANLVHQASLAGLKALDDFDEDDPHHVNEMIRDRLSRRDFTAWERISPRQEETPSETYARRRLAMIDAERARVLEIRDTGKVVHDVVEEVLAMLDVEESMLELDSGDRAPVRGRAEPLLLEGGCEHLREPRPPVEPHTLGQCDACLAAGTRWVHLRMCVTCGNVACCDSSPQRHASRHFEETGHPVMRSAEPEEGWRWCYIDQITG
ncbi:MAG TPA: Na+/H+ antiporter [Marmoricola sp.]|nr:Na+/H+ antiporter [Marmoricola sp.]